MAWVMIPQLSCKNLYCVRHKDKLDWEWESRLSALACVILIVKKPITVKCTTYRAYIRGGGVLNFELDTDVRSEVSTTTL